MSLVIVVDVVVVVLNQPSEEETQAYGVFSSGRSKAALKF